MFLFSRYFQKSKISQLKKIILRVIDELVENVEDRAYVGMW
jgi:hypothetical protein